VILDQYVKGEVVLMMTAVMQGLQLMKEDGSDADFADVLFGRLYIRRHFD